MISFLLFSSPIMCLVLWHWVSYLWSLCAAVQYRMLFCMGCFTVYGRFVAVINVDMACIATQGAVLLAFIICALSVLVLVNV